VFNSWITGLTWRRSRKYAQGFQGKHLMKALTKERASKREQLPGNLIRYKHRFGVIDKRVRGAFLSSLAGSLYLS